jgi:hypothetical protein
MLRVSAEHFAVQQIAFCKSRLRCAQTRMYEMWPQYREAEHVTQACQLTQSCLSESRLKQAAASVVLDLRLKIPDVGV